MDVSKYNEEALKIKNSFNHLPPSERIKIRGYRSYVGSHNAEQWYSIGRLQYHFLIANGLQSCHNFLDIGCGSLRLGQFIIPLLAEGNYYGLEPEKILVECGLEYEISPQVIALKRPNFAHNCNFHFDSLCSFDFAMANSIFTHMNKSDIESCFAEVYKKAKPCSKFFFTFFEGPSSSNPQSNSHANTSWRYSFEELCSLSPQWKLKYIGDWKHPRNQKIVLAQPFDQKALLF